MGYGEEFYARLKELSLLALKQAPSPQLLKQWRVELCQLQSRTRKDDAATPTVVSELDQTQTRKR